MITKSGQWLSLENRPTEGLIQDIDPDAGIPCINVSNVLSDDKKQQVIALERLGWSLQRIEAAVHICRETVAG